MPAKYSLLNYKYKIGAVSYLNTKPLLYGIKQSPIFQNIELIEAYPALLAKHLQEGTIDMALLPVAAIQSINQASIVSDYGIAADGAVASVSIFSQVPMENIERVYLDYQSRTSVRLAEILLRQYWKKEVVYIPATENYIDYIVGANAGVIIGDRALKQLSNFNYVYDLATAWKDYTGLPFVFAAWVSNKPLDVSFLDYFNKANAQGLKMIDQVVADTPFPYYDLKEYYTENIHYLLDESKKEGLHHFLKLL